MFGRRRINPKTGLPYALDPPERPPVEALLADLRRSLAPDSEVALVAVRDRGGLHPGSTSWRVDLYVDRLDGERATRPIGSSLDAHGALVIARDRLNEILAGELAVNPDRKVEAPAVGSHADYVETGPCPGDTLAETIASKAEEVDAELVRTEDGRKILFPMAALCPDCGHVEAHVEEHGFYYCRAPYCVCRYDSIVERQLVEGELPAKTPVRCPDCDHLWAAHAPRLNPRTGADGGGDDARDPRLGCGWPGCRCSERRP